MENVRLEDLEPLCDEALRTGLAAVRYAYRKAEKNGEELMTFDLGRQRKLPEGYIFGLMDALHYLGVDEIQIRPNGNPRDLYEIEKAGGEIDKYGVVKFNW